MTGMTDPNGWRRLENGGYFMPAHLYALGWLCYRVLMLWPTRFYGNAPARLHGYAWAYAEDERQRSTPPVSGPEGEG